MGAIETHIELADPDELFGKQLPAVHSPLESLFGEYDGLKAQLQQISDYTSSHSAAMQFFFAGALVENRQGHYAFNRVMDLEPAMRALNARFWARAMAELTDVLEYMPAARRNNWNELIREHKAPRLDADGREVRENGKVVIDYIPPFERETVMGTLRDLMASRQKFLGERVDGLFRALSGEHVTNAPQGFRKRMIMAHVSTCYDTLNHDRANYVHDLRCVIAKFCGRDAPQAFQTYDDINRLRSSRHYGQWRSFDGGTWRLRVYKNGNAHLEVAEEMAYRLNHILAWLYPAAIPPEFRKRPEKKAPKFTMVHDLLPFEVLAELERMYSSYPSRHDKSGMTMAPDFEMQVSAATEDVLEALGGAKEKGRWTFDYPVRWEVIPELLRTGVLPEQRSHQYYPTPPGLATELVELLEVDPDDIFQEYLEPSAGNGSLAELLPKDVTTCVELSPLRAKILTAKGFQTVVCTDFLEWHPGKTWPRIAMNPPFSGGRAEAHLKKAATLLSPGGVLAAILPAGLRGKELVPGLEHEYGPVRTNEFKGTSVAVVLLRLRKP